MKIMFLTFAGVSLVGLVFTILTDFITPILIALAVFVVLVMLLVPRRN